MKDITPWWVDSLLVTVIGMEIGALLTLAVHATLAPLSPVVASCPF